VTGRNALGDAEALRWQSPAAAAPFGRRWGRQKLLLWKRHCWRRRPLWASAPLKDRCGGGRPAEEADWQRLRRKGLQGTRWLRRREWSRVGRWRHLGAGAVQRSSAEGRHRRRPAPPPKVLPTAPFLPAAAENAAAGPTLSGRRALAAFRRYLKRRSPGSSTVRRAVTGGRVVD